jgi:hypothetical protein
MYTSRDNQSQENKIIMSPIAHHEHWNPRQDHVRHSHADGRIPHHHDPAARLALAVMDDDGFGCAITATPLTRARLGAYLEAKHQYEDLVLVWARTPGEPVPPTVRQAEARVQALKEEGGAGGPGDPLCCQRRGFLHEPAFSVTGCRWITGILEQEAGYHEHWQPGQQLVRHSHAAGRIPHHHDPAAALAITGIVHTTKEK